MTQSVPKLSDRAFFIIALATGLCLQFYPLFLSAFQLTIWDQSDSRLIHYILEHGYQWLKGNPLHAHYLSPPVYQPHPGTLAYSELLVGAVPIYAVFRALFPAEFAYQLWMLACQTLSFASFYFLLTWALGFRRAPAVIGAFLFAFARFKSAQLGHFQLCLQFYAIFSLAFYVRALRGHPRAAQLTVVAFFCFGLQLVTSFYHAWFLSLIVFIALAGALLRPATRTLIIDRARAQWGAHLIGFAVIALILAPFFPTLLAAKRELGPRAFEEVSQLLPRLASWFYMGAESVLYGWTAQWSVFKLPMEHEQRLACGWITMALLAYGTWKYRCSSGRGAFSFLLGVTAFLFIWSLQVSDYTLWRTIHFTFPAGRSIRGVSRISFWLWLPLIIGFVGWLSSALATRGREKWIYALFLLIAAEQSATSPSYPTEAPVIRARAIAVAVPKDCKEFFYLPTSMTFEPHVTHLDAMWAAEYAGIPTINGYSGGYPRGWEELYNHRPKNEEDRKRIEFELRQWYHLKGLTIRPDCWVTLALP